jgi:hypothetical protein
MDVRDALKRSDNTLMTMAARLVEIYKLDDRVEVLFADEAGDTYRRSAHVVRHQRPPDTRPHFRM